MEVRSKKGFLCVTFALPERRDGGDADTLPLIRVYATTRPCTMDAVLREGVGADKPNEPWLVLGDSGHGGETSALQSVALLPTMNHMQVEV